MGIDIEIGFDEDLAKDFESYAFGEPGSIVGFSFGKFVKGVGKGFASAGKAVGKVGKAIVKSPVTQVGVGVLAVAFPAAGIPAAAAVATANMAIRKVEQGQAAAKVVNANLSKLKISASAGDKRAGVAVNAMQIALANERARKEGRPLPIPVAVPGVASRSTLPVPRLMPGSAGSASRFARSTSTMAQPRLLPVPTSLYQRSATPSSLAARLAGGGSPLGQRVLTAVHSEQSVAVPDAVAVVPGQAPIWGRRVWVGKPPTGQPATALNGAHVVTKSGFVLSGQSVFAV